MSPISISPAKIKSIAPLALPIVALYVLKITAAPAPTFAGQQLEEANATPSVRLVRPTRESQRCAEWARSMQGVAVGASPFFYPEREEVAIESIPVAAEEAATPKPRATLDGVMGSGNRIMALINGNLLSVGDAVDGDWTIKSINVERRTVELVHPDGSTCHLETQG